MGLVFGLHWPIRPICILTQVFSDNNAKAFVLRFNRRVSRAASKLRDSDV